MPNLSSAGIACTLCAFALRPACVKGPSAYAGVLARFNGLIRDLNVTFLGKINPFSVQKQTLFGAV